MVSQVRVYWNPKSGFRYLLGPNGFELHKHDFKVRKQKVLLDKKYKSNNNGKDSTPDGNNEQLSLFIEKVIAAGNRMFPQKKTHTLIDRMTVEFIFE